MSQSRINQQWGAKSTPGWIGGSHFLGFFRLPRYCFGGAYSSLAAFMPAKS
jgi:hypothetical protein